MKISPAISLIIIATIFVSCDICSNKDIKIDEGILSWTGDYSHCGCGFFININDNVYKPQNEQIFSDVYKVYDDINIKIEYKVLNRVIESWCFDSQEAIKSDGILIISILDD